MSLNWDVKDIKNHEAVTTLKTANGDEWHPVTQALVWYALICGFTVLTAANAEEIAVRVFAWEDAFGPMCNKGGKPRPITLADVLAHAGLRTNASSKTALQFAARLGKKLVEDAKHTLTRQKAEAAAAAIRAKAEKEGEERTRTGNTPEDEALTRAEATEWAKMHLTDWATCSTMLMVEDWEEHTTPPTYVECNIADDFVEEGAFPEGWENFQLWPR